MKANTNISIKIFSPVLKTCMKPAQSFLISDADGTVRGPQEGADVLETVTFGLKKVQSS